MKKKTAKNKIYCYALSVDFEGGDGSDLFKITNGKGWEAEMKQVEDNFPHMLWASYPPPKVKIVAMTKEQWKRAERIGRELA